MTNKEIGDRIKKRRIELKLTQEDVAAVIGVAKSTISRYEKGTIETLKMPVIQMIASALRVNPDWLVFRSTNMEPLGFSSSDQIVGNVLPVPHFVQRPRLGTIACGEPITAEQNIETYDNVPEDIRCDFTLKCKGDSMIEARIMDGDIVYIKAQPTVENGEIAAVLIEDEATLKRVYLDSNTITLLPCNSKYAPIIYSGEELNTIRIIGKAVGFTSTII